MSTTFSSSNPTWRDGCHMSAKQNENLKCPVNFALLVYPQRTQHHRLNKQKLPYSTRWSSPFRLQLHDLRQSGQTHWCRVIKWYQNLGRLFTALTPFLWLDISVLRMCDSSPKQTSRSLFAHMLPTVLLCRRFVFYWKARPM